jgi:cyanophycinase
VSDAQTPAEPVRRTRFVARRSWSVGLIGVVLVVAGIYFKLWLSQSPVDPWDEIDFVNRFGGGSLVIAGGGSLPPEIRQRFLALAGGPKRARIVIVPAFVADASQIESLCETWRKLGLKSVQVVQARSRDEADLATFGLPLDDATGVWLSGGQQERLSGLYAGTKVEARLQTLIERGGVVGGTSAGAAAMTKVMIEQGVEEATEGRGFDLLRDAIVDQHFLRRSRLNRMMGLLDAHPNRIAFGIDESTALVVQVPKGRLGVIGSSYVVACVPKTEAGTRRFEIMKSGDQIDLAGLIDGRTKISSPADLDSLLSDE